MPAPGSSAKSDERRRSVLEAAIACFAQKGLYGTSTTEIAKLAGISQPYLYRLFPSKEVLFAEVVGYVSELLSGSLVSCMSAGPMEPAEALAAAREAYGDLIKNRDVMQFLMQANCATNEEVVKRAVIDCYSAQVGHVTELLGGDVAAVRQWFGAGMLDNVSIMLGLPEREDHWAKILTGRC